MSATAGFGSTSCFQFSQGHSQNTARTETFAQSAKKTINCVGSMQLPQMHAVPYALQATQTNTTIETSMTLRLIVCSEARRESVIVHQVPGTETTIGSSVCEVVFGSPRFVHTAMPCDEAQRQAILGEANSMPLCDWNNSSRWDGCQCQLKSGSCYCVDSIGGEIVAGTGTMVETEDWRDTCREMGCPDSLIA